MLAASFEPQRSTVYFSRQRVRHLSAALLLVWLFSLFAGVAQACVTQVAFAERHGAVHDLAHCADGVSAAAGEQQAPVSNGACYKFCSEATVPTPKSTASHADTSTAQALHDLALASQWAFDPWLAPVAEGLPPSPASTPRQRLTIPIVYLRLTL